MDEHLDSEQWDCSKPQKQKLCFFLKFQSHAGCSNVAFKTVLSALYHEVNEYIRILYSSRNSPTLNISQISRYTYAVLWNNPVSKGHFGPLSFSIIKLDISKYYT